MAVGDFGTALKCYLAAVADEKGRADYRLGLGIVLQALGNRAEAARQLTVALSLEPGLVAAARRLADVLSRGVLPPGARLEERGLIAALQHDTVDRDLLAAASLHHLAACGPLSRTLERGARNGWDSVARDLCLTRTADLLRNALLLEVLRRGVIVRPDVEALFTAIRRVALLELAGSRLADPVLSGFLSALVEQTWLNEHVWAETAAETAALAAFTSDPAAAVAGDPAACRTLLLWSLYRKPELWLREHVAPNLSTEIRPVAFRNALESRFNNAARMRELRRDIIRLDEISDETSLKVAGQYESAPYPRWTSVALFSPGNYIDYLRTYLPKSRLGFTEKSFEVLIAGCGTGCQAVSAALDYGPNARVLGLDITAASLSYAAFMAEQLKVANLSLAQADIRDIADRHPSFSGRFDVIECTGVLHHMADPFGAWRSLLDCLAPHGVMLIGLYSAVARRNLAVLKSEPDYPGPGCNDASLRAYRARLLARPRTHPGSELLRSRDAHNASGFRDFFLHVSEHATTLAEIDRFLDANGLEFRGFSNVPFAALRRDRPAEIPPGSLGHWAEWETRHPDAFAGMYQFWCTRR